MQKVEAIRPSPSNCQSRGVEVVDEPLKMVLEEPPHDSHSLLQAHPLYKEAASQLINVPTKVVGPRELAVTVPHDSE
ncbi:Uncharacterized protein GBIM_14171 [Gryllus bimaculatus]|nr:Uncharacterized protein GBIM_14171 [Gryllus bimaculatus]